MENVWGEPADTAFLVRGRPDIARALVTSLLEQDLDVAYAYEPLHHPSLPHAFVNTVLFLDYHRRGFDLPGRPDRGELLRAAGDLPSRRR